MSALYFGDKLVAGHIGMRTSEVWHYWFPAYDFEYSHHSPGTILLLEMIGNAASDGMRQIDLGKGDSTYKQRFSNTAVPLAEGRSHRPSAAHSVRRALESSIAWLRSLPIPSAAKLPARGLPRLARKYSRRR